MQTAFATQAITRRKPSGFQKHKRAIAKCKVMVCLALLTGTAPFARGETPPAPPEITPPAGNVLFLTAHAVGTQNYICLPSTAGGGNTWAFFSPQATLSITFLGRFNQQVVTHFLSPVPGLHAAPPPACTLSGETDEVNCPTWQSSLDSSAVWGAKVGSIAPGSDASCPNTGAIPCLLLKAVTTRRGQNDGGVLTRTTYIQRLNTTGGSAPAASCAVGDQALVPYGADYAFYTTKHEDSANSDKP